MEQLDRDERLESYLRRYASAGLYSVLLNDRYQERLAGMKRKTLMPATKALIISYTVGRSVPLKCEENQDKNQRVFKNGLRSNIIEISQQV